MHLRGPRKNMITFAQLYRIEPDHHNNRTTTKDLKKKYEHASKEVVRIDYKLLQELPSLYKAIADWITSHITAEPGLDTHRYHANKKRLHQYLNKKIVANNNQTNNNNDNDS